MSLITMILQSDLEITQFKFSKFYKEVTLIMSLTREASTLVFQQLFLESAYQFLSSSQSGNKQRVLTVKGQVRIKISVELSPCKKDKDNTWSFKIEIPICQQWVVQLNQIKRNKKLVQEVIKHQTDTNRIRCLIITKSISNFLFSN